MAHSVKITMISDQEINIKGKNVSVHDILSISVDSDGLIYDFTTKKKEDSTQEG